MRVGRWRLLVGLGLLGLGLLLVSCAPAASPTSAPAVRPTQAPAAEPTRAPEPTKAPEATRAPAPSASPQAAQGGTSQPTPAAKPSPAPAPELRVIELEFPASLRLGESDVLRLALVPSADGYTARTDFSEHPLETQQVEIPRPPGYSLRGVARLDGPGFEIAPSGEQSHLVPPGETVTWRWSLLARSPGRQRVAISLLLRWEPEPGTSGSPRESLAFGRSTEIQVSSLLGLSQAQAGFMGFVGLLLGGGLGLFAAFGLRPTRPQPLHSLAPNPGLAIEPAAGMKLSQEETGLLQALFRRYARLVLQSEFQSGYSGARTLLAHPVLPGGLADAATIIKIGPRAAIQAEYGNYERFVRDRLPPVTARIQHAPVTTSGSGRAALQYTCISEPGRAPRSLRQALLADPDPALLRRLFETFGPSWWMQRKPYAFRLGAEYDRLLPPQLVLEGLPSGGRPASWPDPGMSAGERVRVPAFQRSELRADGRSFTLWLEPRSGQAPVRLRWLAPRLPAPGQAARVVENRATILAGLSRGMDLCGLQDPLIGLGTWLQEPLQGTLSTIHGDLNLENALVGPGGLVWLIDFAETREGHTLYDFAHLEAEIIAHLLAPRAATPSAFLELLRRGDPLLEAVEGIAQGCLFDPARPREYRLAFVLACLGGLKYGNLSFHQKNCLYLSAAMLAPLG